MENSKIPKFTEFETKYRLSLTDFPSFTLVMESIPGLVNFLFARGPDHYFSRPDGSLGRYRVAQFATNEGKFAQWTVKEKREGAKDNVFRFETNWRIDNTPEEEVYAGALKMGYRFNFKITKQCHIYEYEDATVVFYSVRELTSTQEDYFLEIEVKEETIHNLTEKEAWGVIEKYERLLAPTGINAHKRIRKSLYELYRKF